MSVIDLEILIPASPEFIWRFLGDLQQIARWQTGVESVTFLSTQHEGRGTRWRQTMSSGPDRVVEVSAWYETLGYNYQVVAGVAHGKNSGQIKLREVPEGTLVRWTFQYEPGGMLGGLRNAVGLKGSISSQIQASLRNLHQLISQQSGGISTHEAKATMQEAPDVSARSSYEPRHPSTYQDSRQDDASTEIFPVDGDENPFAFDYGKVPIPASEEGDTKPNPVALAGFISPTDDAKLDDTQPMEIAVPAADPRPTFADDAPRLPLEEPPATTAPPRSKDTDAANMSVFEIFGLQRPSKALLGAEPPAQAIDNEGEHRDNAPQQTASAPAGELPKAAPQTEAKSGWRAVHGARRVARRRAIRGRSQ
ncbi:MAG: SRPBCC family protein [Chloroflexi bacterium]|nr:SRPBCC family protein [Chloroflexota bacterium]MCY4246305.1 SRPBCC family protein [Chloroflexota bacterium]